MDKIQKLELSVTNLVHELPRELPKDLSRILE